MYSSKQLYTNLILTQYVLEPDTYVLMFRLKQLEQGKSYRQQQRDLAASESEDELYHGFLASL